ncbi:hypothetical protein SPURM210S_02462 [Streptomyces purpurascens]
MSRRTALAALAALTLGTGLAVLPTQAQAATVVVSNSADLANAIKNAAPGTVIQVRGGTYYPTATLQSTANGTSSSPVTLTAYGSETVKIDGSNLPDGDWIFKLTADYWNVSKITFQNSPDSAVVCQSCTGTVWNDIKTIDGGDSGFTLTGDGTVNNTVRNIDSYGHYDAATHGENADGIAVKFGAPARATSSPGPACTTTPTTASTSGRSPRRSPSSTPGRSATARTAGATPRSRVTATATNWAVTGRWSPTSSTTRSPGTTPATASPRTATGAPSSSTGPRRTPTPSGATTSRPARRGSGRTSP